MPGCLDADDGVLKVRFLLVEGRGEGGGVMVEGGDDKRRGLRRRGKKEEKGEVGRRGEEKLRDVTNERKDKRWRS